MVAEALKEKVMNYFTLLDDEQAQMVITYIETIDVTQKKKQKNPVFISKRPLAAAAVTSPRENPASERWSMRLSSARRRWL